MASKKGCLSRVVVVVIALTVIAALVVALAVMSLGTSWGEERVKSLVTNIVNDDLIEGQVTVGALHNIEVLDPIGVVRADVELVRIFDPEEVEVLKVEKATVEFDAQALMKDEIRFVGADVDGGVVTIEMDANDELRIQTAFTETNAPFEPFPFDIQLRNMRAKNMELVVHPTPNQTFWFGDLTGTTDVISLGDEPGVEVLFSDFTGKLDRPKPLGIQLDILNASGKVDGASDKVVDIDYRTRLGSMGKASGTFRLYPDDDQPAKLQLRPEGLLAKIAAIGADIGTAFSGQIDVQIMK